MSRKSKPWVCGRLIRTAAGTTDICGLEHEHDRGSDRTPHQGRWKGISWRIEDNGETFIESPPPPGTSTQPPLEEAG